MMINYFSNYSFLVLISYLCKSSIQLLILFTLYFDASTFILFSIKNILNIFFSFCKNKFFLYFLRPYFQIDFQNLNISTDNSK